MDYRGVKIQMLEGKNVVASDVTGTLYSVSREDGLVFAASCDYGVAYALQPQQALEDVKALIDRVL